jgi:hypothetical protein
VDVTCHVLGILENTCGVVRQNWGTPKDHETARLAPGNQSSGGSLTRQMYDFVYLCGLSTYGLSVNVFIVWTQLGLTTSQATQTDPILTIRLESRIMQQIPNPSPNHNR